MLGKLGFPETIINWIKTLYRGARATIIVNGNIGDGIEFEKGIKQGCPLSMYLLSRILNRAYTWLMMQGRNRTQQLTVNSMLLETTILGIGN